MKQLSSLLKISVSLCLFFLQFAASGEIPYGIPAGAAEAGMAYACVTKDGFGSSFHNQALLAFNNSFSFGTTYMDRFGISELSTRTAALIIPAGKASVAAGYSGFGYRDYRRDAAAIACGMKLAGKIAAGVQADYFTVRTYGEYNNSSYITFEAGVIIIPSDRTRIGIHVFNPVPNSLRKEKLPSSVTTGAGIILSKDLFAGAEVSISTGKKMELCTGCEYEVMKDLRLRTGFATGNNSFCFGTGYRFRAACLDIGFATHDRLGVTSSLTLIINIK